MRYLLSEDPQYALKLTLKPEPEGNPLSALTSGGCGEASMSMPSTDSGKRYQPQLQQNFSSPPIPPCFSVQLKSTGQLESYRVRVTSYHVFLRKLLKLSPCDIIRRKSSTMRITILLYLPPIAPSMPSSICLSTLLENLLSIGLFACVFPCNLCEASEMVLLLFLSSTGEKADAHWFAVSVEE